MKKKTLILDVDGVLRNVLDAIIAIYKREYDPSSKICPEDVIQYNMSTIFPKVEDIGATFFGKHAKEVFFDKATLYEADAAKTLTNLCKSYLIHICSHQFRGNENYTLEFLAKHNIPYDFITFSADKAILFGDVIVDDSSDNLKKILAQRKDILPICLDRPWNQEYQGHRIKSLKQLADYMQPLI